MAALTLEFNELPEGSIIGVQTTDRGVISARAVPAGGGAGGTTAPPVESLAELRALSTTDGTTVTDGQTRAVLGDLVPWTFDFDSGAGFADDANTIVQPDDVLLVQNGRWYRNTSAPVMTTIAALRLAVSGQHQVAQVKAYSQLGDNGGGTFVLDSTDTTSPDNGGTVIVAGDQRWIRKDSTRLTVAHFGARNDFVEMTAQFGANVISMNAGSAAILGHVFSPAEIGAKIMIRGAGAAGDDLVSTIASTTTIAAAASTTVVGTDAFWGSDSLAGINAALAYRAQGGTVFLDAAGGYLIDGRIDMDGMSGTILDGSRGRAYRRSATICNIATSGSAITTAGSHGVQLHGLRVMNANKANTDIVIDLKAVTPGVTSDTANITIRAVVVDGNPSRSSDAAFGLGGCITCNIGSQTEPCEIVRCARGVWRNSGYANETTLWIGTQECGDATNTAYAVQDPGDGWVIHALLEPGLGRPHRGIGYTKDGFGWPLQASAGGTWRVWAGDALTAGGIAIEVFGSGIRVGGHFEDAGAGSRGIVCYAGSQGIQLMGGSVFRLPIGVEFVTDAPFTNATLGFAADPVDFGGCPTPYIGVLTGAVNGFADCNGAALGIGFAHAMTGGFYSQGLGIFGSGLTARGWGQLDDSASVYLGFLGNFPEPNTKSGCAVAALEAGTANQTGSVGVFLGDRSLDGEFIVYRLNTLVSPGSGLPYMPQWDPLFRVGTAGWFFKNGVLMASGIGSPEGVISAPVGSTWQREDGGALTAFYVKETGGAGSSGWAAK